MEDEDIRKPGIGRTIRNQFMAGLLVTVPLGATILILVWLFNSIDHILQPIINAIWHREIPGVGFGVTIILIFLAGIFTRNVIGHRILKWGSSLLDRIPIFRLIYKSMRQILNSFSIPDKAFTRVVLVDFPKKGMKALAFVTNEITDKDGKKWFSVLIPTAPNPTTGFMEIVSEEDITQTNISIDDGIKMVISAGKVMSDDVRTKIR
jgi:uncharacterized membrane protein